MAQEPVKKDPIKVIREQAQARGIDPEIALQIARAESTMDPMAKSKTSSAGGLFQITDGTWKQYGGKPGMKFDVDENVRVGLNILEANTKRLRKSLDREPNITELYAAHFLGSSGGPKVMMADRAVPVDKVLSEQAMEANPMLKGKTVGDVVAILDRKMGVKPQVATAQPAVTPAAPMPASAAGAPKRVAEAPVAPVAPKAAGMGTGYQAALALAFLGDEEEKAEKGEKGESDSAAKMMAAYKPYNALKDFDLGPSIFAQLPLTPGQAQAQPQQPKMMAEGGEVGDPNYVSVLERGDMSSPAYRAQLEREQGLELSTPELVVAPMVKGAVTASRAALDKYVNAKHGPGVDKALREAREFDAWNKLTAEQKIGYRESNPLARPPEFYKLLESGEASAIGSHIGRMEMPGSVAARRTPQENMERLARKLLLHEVRPVVNRTAVDMGLQVANQMQDAYRRYGSMSRAEVEAHELENLRRRMQGLEPLPPPVKRQEGSPETGEIAPEVQKFQTNSSPDDLLANRAPYRSAAEQLAYLEAANPKVFINNKPMREGVSGYVSSAFPNVLNIAENLSPAQDEYVKLHEMEHSLDFRGGDILGRKGHGGTDSAYRAYYLLNKNWKPVETLVENVLSNKDKLEKFFGRPMQDYLNVKPEAVNKLLQNPSKLRSLFGEQIASLSALEQLTGKSLTRDPEMRDLFPNTQMMSVYDALTGLRQTRLDARDLPPHTPLPSYTYEQNPIIRAIKKRTFGPNEFGIPVKRAGGSPETGEEAGPTPEELEAASRPAFLTPRSGIGRRQSMTSGQVNDAVLAGIAQTPYNLLGAPVDLTALAMTPFGYSNPTPVMGSEWIKQKMTEAGVRPATPTQPTARALYEMGQFGAGLVNPAAPVRGAVAAGQAAGRTAREAMQDFQAYNRQLAVPGASYAVRPKGGEFVMERPYRDKTGAAFVHPVDRYLSTSSFDVQGDAALETWVNEKLGRYMRRDMASPDDQFVKAADEGKLLHFMLDGEPVGGPSFSSLPYTRKIEGFNPQGEARTPYGKRVEEQVDATVEPAQLQDLEGSEQRLSPALQREIKTNPEKRVYQLFGDEVTDRLQFPSMVDAMHTIRHGNGMFKAYGQSVPIPKEFQFSDETLKGMSPAQASERLARYISWSDSARQKAAAIAITKNPRISTTKMEGGYTWAEIPDTEANPEILDLVKDTGCAGGWCTEQPNYALEYGSGENRLHLLVDNKANPKVQLTVKQFEPNIQDFLAQFDDDEYERLARLVDPNFHGWLDWDNPAKVAALKQLPEYKSWAAANPAGASISEIKGPANTTNLKNSPALRATQDYVKKLDAENSLASVANLSGINMMERDGLDIYNALVERYAALPQGTHNQFLEQVQARASNDSYKGSFALLLEQARALIDQKNGGSRYIVREDGPRLLKETLDEIFSPFEKANGGMVERRTDDSRKYL